MNPYTPFIIKFAKAIQAFEGYFKPSFRYPFGTASWRNNNPFNMRYGTYAVSLGAIGKSPAGYARFLNYQMGFNAGCQLLTDACSGKLAEYNPNLGLFNTLALQGDSKTYGFYQVFAPAWDSNNPQEYANVIAAQLGVSIVTPISQFLKVV